MVEPQPGTPNVSLSWIDATTDHFGFEPADPPTFRQRVFTYDRFWDPKAGAIWFYCGNEANVELYVNATGLMWENAKEAKALLVFAEHRYYGESLLYPGVDPTTLPREKMKYLTMEQALADYATVIKHVKSQLVTTAPVVAFGGSYGGMLAAWLRMKYPASVVGAIAASAPILAFGAGWDSNAYWQVVTRDATPEAGAADGCDAAIRAAWPILFKLGETAAGRTTLSSAFKLCKPLETTTDVVNLAWMMLFSWDTMAMGNFPFPSNYLVFQNTGDPTIKLPAFPVRVACDRMVPSPADDVGKMEALRDAAAVLYNVTANEQCYDVSNDPNYDGIWDYQWCSEMLPQETYFTLDGTRDMFWSRPMNMTAIDAHCKAEYGFAPRQEWILTEFGGDAGIAAASNIVFSNGLYDPWSSGGVGVKEASMAASRVVELGINKSIKAVVIDHGAHHLDLMFSNHQDPKDVKAARKLELEQIAGWTREANQVRLRQ